MSRRSICPWAGSIFRIATFAAVAAAGSALLLAAPGDLDLTFGTSGQVTTHFGGFDAATSVAVQADGKIVAAGIADELGFNQVFAVARYDANGALDPSFGTGGTLELPFSPGSLRVDVAIDGSGNIILAGTTIVDAALSNSDFILMRLTPGGSLDPAFGAGGLATTDFFSQWDEGNSVAIQNDGRIVVAGTARRGLPGQWIGIADFAIARFNADGTPDTSFDVDGKTTVDFYGFDDLGNGLAIQGDGRIVVAGSASHDFGVMDFGVVRFDANGALDASFDADGLVTTDIGMWDDGTAVAIQADGNIVVVGGTVVPFGHYYEFALARYDTSGALDPGFGAGGKVVTDFILGSDYATDVLIQGDGRIVAAGWASDPADVELLIDFGLARYDTNGALDPTFGIGGKVMTDFGHIDYGQAVALQSDCKIVMAGYSWPVETGDSAFALSRYDAGDCPEPNEFSCPNSQGYWQTHPDLWPVSSLTLGSESYTKAELLALLNSPTRGDASLVLAQQLIAALLNLANGSDPAPVSGTITHAQGLLSAFAGKLGYGVNPSTPAGQAMVADATVLNEYNKGLLTICGAPEVAQPLAAESDLARVAGPSVTDCTAEQGQIYIEEGRYQKAIGEFTCVIEAAPTEVEGYRGRIEAELLLGRYSDAVNDYTRVTAHVVPVQPDAGSIILAGYAARLADAPEDVPALTGASFAHWWLFQYPQAIQVLNTLIGVQPDNLYGTLFRGSSRVLRGMTPQGAPDLEAAIAIAPDSPDVRFIVADAYTYGEPDPARALAEATLALDGGLDTARVHAILASAYHAFGDEASSATHIQRHLDLVTTELVPTNALDANSSLDLPLVAGRTYEIPVPANAGETVWILTSSHDFVDTILVLLGPDGAPVTGSDDDKSYFAGIQWVAPAGGTYKMRVTSFEAASTGGLLVTRK